MITFEVIKSGVRYLIATLEITISPDIYYFPSQTVVTKNDSIDFIIDHISFHKDGRVHVKTKENKRLFTQKGNYIHRLPLRQTGQQILLTDFIEDYKTLPIISSETGLQTRYFFDLDTNHLDYTRSFLRIDLLNGVNVIKKEYDKIPQSDEEGSIDFIQMIPLGWQNNELCLVVYYAEYKGLLIPSGRELCIKFSENKPKSAL